MFIQVLWRSLHTASFFSRTPILMAFGPLVKLNLEISLHADLVVWPTTFVRFKFMKCLKSDVAYS